MDRILVNVLKSVLCVGLTASCLLATAPAQADEDYPPDGYIATYRPAYYEGRPVYYYGGYWYYRDGRAWHHYASEPRYLHDYRGGHSYYGAPHYYGRAHGGGYRHR
jgi:hypothetical protein